MPSSKNAAKSGLARRARSAASMCAATATLVAGGFIWSLAVGSSADADPFNVRANGGLNVRAQPDVRSKIIGGLRNGAPIDSTGPATNGFVPITFGGQTAWVSARYLDDRGALTGISPGTVGDVFTTAAVYARSGPSVDHRVITMLEKYERATVTGKTSGVYSEANYRGQIVWIASQYLAKSTPVTVPVQPSESPRPIASSTPSATREPSEPAPTTPGQPTTQPTSTTPVPTATTPTATAEPTRQPTATSNPTETAIPTTTPTPTVTATVQPTEVPEPSEPPEPTETSQPTEAPRPTETPTAVPTRPPTVLPEITQWRTARVELMIRTSPGPKFVSIKNVPPGTRLGLTGVYENGLAQIVFEGNVRWVNGNYFVDSQAPKPNPLPQVVGSKWATAKLDIRTSSGNDARTVTEVAKGTELKVTGLIQNGREQIIFDGAVRWVTAKYLADKPPSVEPVPPTNPGSGIGNVQPHPSLNNLPDRTQQTLVSISKAFPEIKVVYGRRNQPGSDHHTGYALDVMLPKTGRHELGLRVRDWAQRNAKQLNVDYLVFEKQIWSVKRSKEGWRNMADRGSDTANHLDHVHISIYNGLQYS